MHSERFLQTDQLITRLHVVVMTKLIRMLMRNVFVNVFKSDAMIGRAAIFRTSPPPPLSPPTLLPLPLPPPLPHLPPPFFPPPTHTPLPTTPKFVLSRPTDADANIKKQLEHPR